MSRIYAYVKDYINKETLREERVAINMHDGSICAREPDIPEDIWPDDTCWVLVSEGGTIRVIPDR